ncbi:MAG: VCBS repeat-containing protein [Planctomycetes bacterium]|nr:VCBS repeat-containing protein [Planctomycetota bacterium]
MIRSLIAASLLVSLAPAQFAGFRELDRLPGTQSPGTPVWTFEANGDRFPDIHFNPNYAVNLRRGSFGIPIRTTTGFLRRPGFGDVDGDGDNDVWVPLLRTDILLLNDGSGIFTEAPSSRIPQLDRVSYCAQFMDVDLDGDLDCIVGLGTSALASGIDCVYLNDGRGTFSVDPRITRLPPDEEAWELQIGDLDGDGDSDVLAGGADWISPGVGSATRIYWNDGSGVFVRGPTLGILPGDWTRIADIDRDGDLDVLCSGYYGGAAGVSCFVNVNGRGTFALEQRRLPGLAAWGRTAAVGDVDGDGDVDIVANVPVPAPGGGYQSLNVWLNDGTGYFVDATTTSMPSFVLAFTSGNPLADFDGDGDLDVVAQMHNGTIPVVTHTLWNMTRQLYPPHPPRIGQPHTVELHGNPGAQVWLMAAFAPAYVDLGLYGVLGLDPTTLVTGPGLPIPGSRMVPLTFAIPNDPNLVGASVFWQATYLDFTTSIPTLHVSNTFEDVIQR